MVSLDDGYCGWWLQFLLVFSCSYSMLLIVYNAVLNVDFGLGIGLGLACWPIILFSLYILFPHYRLLWNDFFEMSFSASADVCINYEHTKGKFPWGLLVICIGKQNLQAKEVHCISSDSLFLLFFIQVGCIRYPLFCRTALNPSSLILGSLEVTYENYFCGMDSPLAQL